MNQERFDESTRALATTRMPRWQVLKRLPVAGLIDGEIRQLLGYYAAGDGGGGLFRWDAASTAKDNRGSILRPASRPASGRWRRIWDGGPVNVLWFGAKRDNTGDQTAAVHAAQAVATATSEVASPVGWTAGGVLYFPRGTYRCTTAITPGNYLIWQGDGPNQSVLHWASSGTFISCVGDTPAGVHLNLKDIQIFGSDDNFLLYRAVNIFSTSHYRVMFRGTSGETAGGLDGSLKSGQVGVSTPGSYGDNHWVECLWLKLGSGLKPGDIGNSWHACQWAYCYKSIDSTATLNGGGYYLGCTFTGYEIDTGLNLSHVWIPQSSNHYSFVNCWFEKAQRPIVLGDSANTGAGGPVNFTAMNCSVNCHSGSQKCIEIAVARQTSLANLIFGAVSGTPTSVYFPTPSSAQDGMITNPVMFNSIAEIKPEDLPARWSLTGRTQSKVGDDGLHIGSPTAGPKVLGGGHANPNTLVAAPQGSIYASTSGVLYVKTTGGTTLPYTNTGWAPLS